MFEQAFGEPDRKVQVTAVPVRLQQLEDGVDQVGVVVEVGIQRASPSRLLASNRPSRQ